MNLNESHSALSFSFQELDILRSFFLLARGELFQNFIEEADTLLRENVYKTLKNNSRPPQITFSMILFLN